jgi:hypothetical protein
LGTANDHTTRLGIMIHYYYVTTGYHDTKNTSFCVAGAAVCSPVTMLLICHCPVIVVVVLVLGNTGINITSSMETII